MPRRRRRLIIAIVLLVLLLALIGAAYWNYRTTRTIGLDIDFNAAEMLDIPQYLYSFSGEGEQLLARPLGVLASRGRVYVTDGRRGVVAVFTPQGTPVATWGAGKLVTPLYIARHPQTGDFYVSDRRLRTIVILDSAGTVKGEFDPKLPKSELPTFETGDVQWAPLALDFAADGTLYVTEILNGHRLLIFDSDGTFRKSVGTAGLVADARTGEELFQFPNSVKVQGDEVWIADSNNRRMQVFDREGVFKRLVVTQGLPRGFEFLPKLTEDEPLRFVVIDTLSHDGTIWDADKGTKVLTFGERGVLEAQFSYPNDASVDGRRLIFVADSANGRIQVWGWPDVANPVPMPTTPIDWAVCLSPLLLLPLLLLLRRRRYFATEDFVLALYEADALDRMPSRRVRWEVRPEDYEALRGLKQGDVDLAELLHPVEHSESDAKALEDRYHLEHDDAVALSIAQRARLFGTEDFELRRMARVMEFNVVNHLEFIERRTRSKGGTGPGSPASGPNHPENVE